MTNILRPIRILWAACLVLLLGNGVLEFAAAQAPDTSSASFAAAQAPDPVLTDTLHFEGRSGETLFFTLPDSVQGRAVQSYDARSLPAMSWLIDQAFVWRLVEMTPGTYGIRFRAHFSGSPPAPVVARIRIHPAQ